ncbi:MAG: right-handed parallel beta-helix repeat-containing protein [Candidatus Cloacimonetes bacterium]|nr:right-handed parallel beta-helix repeat-containing protein [Candidatus Cloacimonadota bacterium]
MTAVRNRFTRFSALAIMIIFAGIACNDDEQSWTIESLSGVQSNSVTFTDRTRVTVDQSVAFAENTSLNLSGQVEFLMGENTQFDLPQTVSIASSSHIVFKASGTSAWSKLRAAHPEVNLHDVSISGSIIGLDLSGAGNVRLENVTITGCEQYGMYAVSLDSLVVLQCSFSNCESDAAHVKFCKGRFWKTTFSNSVNGVYALDNSLVFTDCTFRSNGLTETGSGMRNLGNDAAYRVEHCLFTDNYYGIHDIANHDVELVYSQFSNTHYFPLLFAHPFTERVLIEQNNILPGPGERRIELTTTGNYRVGRHLPAANNWWGTTDTTVVTSISSFVGDGRHVANTDTIRIEPILLTPVPAAGPR